MWLFGKKAEVKGRNCKWQDKLKITLFVFKVQQCEISGQALLLDLISSLLFKMWKRFSLIFTELPGLLNGCKQTFTFYHFNLPAVLTK